MRYLILFFISNLKNLVCIFLNSTVSGFIKHTFCKQRRYLRQDIDRQLLKANKKFQTPFL